MKSYCLKNNAVRTVLISLLLLSPVLAVQAQPELQACTLITDPQQRLACYDQAMGVTTVKSGQREALPPAAIMPTESKVPAGSATHRSPAPVVTESPADDFGLPPRRTEAEEQEVSREYTVVSAHRTDFTGWVMTFSNGDTWKQVGTDSYRIREGETYRISRNGFDSYFLGNASNRRKMRVVRAD